MGFVVIYLYSIVFISSIFSHIIDECPISRHLVSEWSEQLKLRFKTPARREIIQGKPTVFYINMNRKVTMKSQWIAVFLLPLWLTSACETKLSVFYIKNRNPEELKIRAFERCGRHYLVLDYVEDTARIKCL